MKILSTQQIKQADAYTIENEPIASIDLMERAARECYNWLLSNLLYNKPYKIFAGNGNNGGDGLALARMLCDCNESVQVFLLSENLSPDAQINYIRLKEQNIAQIIILNEINSFPQLSENDIVIDSLFGSGLTRPLQGFVAEVVEKINNSNAKIISIDIPSGLFGEDNTANYFTEKSEYQSVIKADYTITFQFPFLSFLFPENAEYVGVWEVLDIGLHPKFIEEVQTDYYLVEKQDISNKIKSRSKFAHKGNFGHALLIAGCYGKMGAAVLAAKASLRCGVGLLTVHLPSKGVDIVQVAVPEAMLQIDNSGTRFSAISELSQFQAIGVGPAIGKNTLSVNALHELIVIFRKPMVFDADAINILSDNKEWLNELPENCIFTPHVKEFERLVGLSSNNYERLQLQIEFAKKYKCFLILKGAHTAIACPDGVCYFNTTGNAGMATAGSGDVLTGIILSFLSQGYTPKEAAIMGVFVHGFSGDMAVEKKGQISLIASDIIDYLPEAFLKIKSEN